MLEFLLDLLKLLKFVIVVTFTGSLVTLTSSPVDMKAGSRLELESEKPLKVLTPGASVRIDVTSMRPAHIESREDTYKWGDDFFGKHSISATLLNTSNGHTTTVSHLGGLAIVSNDLILFLRKGEGLERGGKYDKIIVETDVELHGVTMTWSSWRL